MFYVCGAFTVLGTLVFGGFAVGEVEPWAAGGDVESDVTSGGKKDGATFAGDNLAMSHTE